MIKGFLVTGIAQWGAANSFGTRPIWLTITAVLAKYRDMIDVHRAVEHDEELGAYFHCS
jgi:hypothetical protein